MHAWISRLRFECEKLENSALAFSFQFFCVPSRLEAITIGKEKINFISTVEQMCV